MLSVFFHRGEAINKRNRSEISLSLEPSNDALWVHRDFENDTDKRRHWCRFYTDFTLTCFFLLYFILGTMYYSRYLCH